MSLSGFPLGQLAGYDGGGNLVAPASGEFEGENGRYEIEVTPGQYSTRATTKVQWQGREFRNICTFMSFLDGLVI